jgi:hypothetical protein
MLVGSDALVRLYIPPRQRQPCTPIVLTLEVLELAGHAMHDDEPSTVLK